MAKRRAPRWTHLSSWVVAAVIWLWIMIALFFGGVAIVMAVFAMFLVHLVGRGAAWLKLRFVEGKWHGETRLDR